MHIDVVKLTLAGIFTTVIFWTLCSLAVVFFPEQMMKMTGHMLHADLHDVAWTITFGSFLAGLSLWCATVGSIIWLCTSLYKVM